MKRILTLLLAVSVLMLSLAVTDLPSARAAVNEVTILAYICGADLESDEGEASGDLREMLSTGIGGSGAVTAIVATGGCTRWQQFNISSRTVQYHRLGTGGPELLKDAGRRNMGDAGTLSDFLSFALSAAPAKRYILVFWDHGGGPVFGLCNDQNFQDDSLSLAELRTGLKNGLNGTKMDIIAFDCCLMNCVDLCYDLCGFTDHAVVSQELVSGTGLNYDEWIKPIVENPSVSTQSIAMNMVDTYIAENSRGRDASTATMTVVSMDKMPSVMDAANAFSASLAREIQNNLSGVVRLRNQLTSFGEFMDYDASDLVDVEDMCTAFSALLPQESENLKQAARQAVSYNVTTSDIASYAHGLSFFLPQATVRNDRQDILEHYSSESGSYAGLAVVMTNQAASSGYTMSASSYTPSNFYYYDDYYDDYSCSGSLCDIWDGYYGDYCSFDDAWNSCGGDIWAGLNTDCGSIWDGYSSSSGIWSGYQPGSSGSSGSTSASGIWSGLPADTGSESSSPVTLSPVTASSAMNNIWSGLANTGSDFYQPGETNQNLQTGISEAVTPETVIDTANSYFSSSSLSSQMIYSIQLNKTDLDHLSAAGGVLSIRQDDETIRLGNIGEITVDWSTGLVFSMFDGSWPMLGNQMVRAEFLYKDDAGNVRFVIPAKVNGLKMYLLGNRTVDGKTELLGATQGYDENGFAIRGSIPLEAGMTIYPLFTAVSPDGTEREYEGEAITVPAEGLQLVLSRIPAGNYQYCFGLTDLSGQVHYTDSVNLTF
ncbi:MAG: hypothetical protein IKO25_05235 [Clostridia bacterium]|nr:hypothetical protein [Clostridia bacterium]